MEKLGAYELVRKDSLKSLAVLQPQPYLPQQKLGSRTVGRVVLACRHEEDQNAQVQPARCGMRDCALCIPKQVFSHPRLFHPPLAQQSGSPWEGELVVPTAFSSILPMEKEPRNSALDPSLQGEPGAERVPWPEGTHEPIFSGVL